MAYPEKKERNKEIWEKHLKGLSYREIGDFYHINKSAVYRILKRFTSLPVDKSGVDTSKDK